MEDCWLQQKEDEKMEERLCRLALRELEEAKKVKMEVVKVRIIHLHRGKNL